MTQASLLKSAPQFDVHKWSDYPEVKNVVDAIFQEIKDLRKQRKIRVRGENDVKKSLKVVILDMWVANILGNNPYRGISKNKTDYQKGDRYRKIHLKYDYLIPVINDLRDLGYINENLGYRCPTDAKRTRISPTDKLLNKILEPEYGLNEVVDKKGAVSFISRYENIETIILKNEEKQPIEYEDNEFTNLIRSNLDIINTSIRKARITLDITDEQHKTLISALNRDENYRESIDFTRVNLYRVFNNSSWQLGGRFYGGWWQSIPKEYRKYIDINHKPTVEVDYSGHHIRMLYANAGLKLPDDPYDLKEFDRDLQKRAMLILINSSKRLSAAKAIRKEFGILATPLLNALEIRHEPIKQYFYSGAGIGLMYEDSIIAEKVMLEMLNKGATVLPVHDSFIVRNSYQKELEEVMENVFTEIYANPALLKTKITSLEEINNMKEWSKNNLDVTEEFVTVNLEELVKSSTNNYTWYRHIWGD